MTCPDCHPAFVCGLEMGLALRCDRDSAEADHEALHAAIRPLVAAMVADLNRRGAGDFEQLQERRRQHQIEAWQANLAAARRWPPETAPPPGPWPSMRSLPFQRRAS